MSSRDVVNSVSRYREQGRHENMSRESAFRSQRSSVGEYQQRDHGNDRVGNHNRASGGGSRTGGESRGSRRRDDSPDEPFYDDDGAVTPPSGEDDDMFGGMFGNRSPVPTPRGGGGAAAARRPAQPQVWVRSSIRDGTEDPDHDGQDEAANNRELIRLANATFLGARLRPQVAPAAAASVLTTAAVQNIRSPELRRLATPRVGRDDSPMRPPEGSREAEYRGIRDRSDSVGRQPGTPIRRDRTPTSSRSPRGSRSAETSPRRSDMDRIVDNSDDEEGGSSSNPYASPTDDSRLMRDISRLMRSPSPRSRSQWSTHTTSRSSSRSARQTPQQQDVHNQPQPAAAVANNNALYDFDDDDQVELAEYFCPKEAGAVKAFGCGPVSEVDCQLCTSKITSQATFDLQPQVARIVNNYFEGAGHSTVYNRSDQAAKAFNRKVVPQYNERLDCDHMLTDEEREEAKMRFVTGREFYCHMNRHAKSITMVNAIEWEDMIDEVRRLRQFCWQRTRKPGPDSWDVDMVPKNYDVYLKFYKNFLASTDNAMIKAAVGEGTQVLPAAARGYSASAVLSSTWGSLAPPVLTLSAVINMDTMC